MNMMETRKLDLQLFADAGTVVNTTGGTVNANTGASTASGAMSSAMKTYYDTELLENARDEAVYGQLGKHQALPRNHGKSVEWRKWNTLPEPDKLVEGVIPEGKKFGQTSLNVGIAQYGEYVSISDQLELHAIDDTILGATEEIGAAMGSKADLLTRDAILAGCSCVLIAPSGQTANTVVWKMDKTALFTADLVARAATELKKKRVPTIDGKYVAVIHPSVAYNLRKDSDWVNAHQYAAVTEIFNGEIGELHGVRFIETPQAPVLAGASLYSDTQRYLTLTAGAADTPGTAVTYGQTGAYKFTVSEALTGATADYSKLIGQYVLLQDDTVVTHRLKVTGVDTKNKLICVDTAPADYTFASGDYLVPGNGGRELKSENVQNAAYATLIFGKDAFGVVDPEGAGMEMIIKSKDQAGGPLNQFSTVGGKMSHAARVLYPERVLCIYATASNSAVDESNWHE